MSLFGDEIGILTKIFNAIPSLVNSVLIRGQKQRWRDDFSGSSLSSDWTAQIGSAQSVTVSSSELQIVTGTLAGQTIIKCSKKFNFPCKVSFIAKLSQRIVNQEFYLEVIDSSGNNYARHLLTGTSATASSAQVANNGTIASTFSLSTFFSTASYNGFEIDLNFDEVKFSIRDLTGTAGRSSISSTYQKIPDPTLDYSFQIRAVNVATVSSSTTFSVDAVSFSENEIFTADMLTGRGGKSANDSMPVVLTGNSSNVVIANNSVAISTTQTFASVTTTNLGANASYVASAVGATGRSTLIVVVDSDQAGNLYVGQSQDGTIYLDFGAKPCVSGVNVFTIPVYLAFYKIRYINGSTAQTRFRVYSQLKSI